VTTVTERVGFIDGPLGPLFCAVSEPDTPADRALILAGGGWMGSSTNRNSVLVRMARAVAAQGLVAARFDWRGTGESAGSIARFDLEVPFHDDVTAVIGEIGAGDVGSVALSGICFGAWSCLVAAELEEIVDQVILISLPFPSDKTKADHKADRIGLDSALRAMSHPALWGTFLRNREMRVAATRAIRRKLLGSSTGGQWIPTATTTAEVPQILGRLARRGVKIDLIFGEQDLEYASYLSFIAGTPLPQSIRISVIPGDLSNFGTLAAQEAAVEAVVGALVD
jgi:alpha/beta superfamily hydrolase